MTFSNFGERFPPIEHFFGGGFARLFGIGGFRYDVDGLCRVVDGYLLLLVIILCRGMIKGATIFRFWPSHFFEQHLGKHLYPPIFLWGLHGGGYTLNSHGGAYRGGVFLAGHVEWVLSAFFFPLYYSSLTRFDIFFKNTRLYKCLEREIFFFARVFVKGLLTSKLVITIKLPIENKPLFTFFIITLILKSPIYNVASLFYSTYNKQAT